MNPTHTAGGQPEILTARIGEKLEHPTHDLMLTSLIPNFLCAALCLLIVKALMETANGCLRFVVGSLLLVAALLLQALALMIEFTKTVANRWGAPRRECP